ncbi:MAG: polyhydroxyalkanoate synthesis repressor PhaR [Rubrivivax sp. SCN 71-131]|jgi:polyhydroxyalkanoate synthesis repressor PhaR|nr:MAG: polyhydroxyalkanoate synthesis repressor PhaR [Rubrivivax sp. SCN 71-131]
MPTTRRKPDPEAGKGGVRVLKKYPNRRLYDSRASSYITLADVKKMVMAAEEFEVRDAKTNEDITRSILLQIILEEESGGVPMFSTQTLAQIIRFYGHAMQGMMGGFMEHNLRAFADLQQRLAAQGKGLVDPKAFTPELWSQFLGAQAPLMQGLVGPYFEQSRALFDQMQEQLQKGALFPGVAGFTRSTDES